MACDVRGRERRANRPHLLTKGRHEGPDLVDPLRTQVSTWLAAEAQSVQATQIVSTQPFAVAMGANTVDLSQALPALAGAQFTFTAAMTGTVMELTTIRLTAPATTGMHVVFPIFAVLPPGGQEGDDTSFSNADVSLSHAPRVRRERPGSRNAVDSGHPH